MGNICRSPMAEGIFRHCVTNAELSDLITIDSAGTGAWHVGAAPDKRAQKILLKNDIDISFQRARKITQNDFTEFDMILAMDESNYDNLLKIAPEHFHDKIQLFLNFSESNSGGEVPDPYYGGDQGFIDVFRLVKDASDGLLIYVETHLNT